MKSFNGIAPTHGWKSEDRGYYSKGVRSVWELNYFVGDGEGAEKMVLVLTAKVTPKGNPCSGSPVRLQVIHLSQFDSERKCFGSRSGIADLELDGKKETRFLVNAFEAELQKLQNQSKCFRGALAYTEYK